MFEGNSILFPKEHTVKMLKYTHGLKQSINSQVICQNA